jgi:hypothetical protein
MKKNTLKKQVENKETTRNTRSRQEDSKESTRDRKLAIPARSESFSLLFTKYISSHSNTPRPLRIAVLRFLRGLRCA